MTKRLFDEDSYIKEFEARVISCETDGNKYTVVLDKTAFFPEEGGQSSDTGRIGEAEVSHVYEKNGVIFHVCDREVSGDVRCILDFEERYRKMQNHTGEHIFCGAVFRLFGYNNVGFHLSEEYVRVDIDGLLSKEDVERAELEANLAVTGCHPIKAWYPTREELEKADYRSKGEIDGSVRLVEIKAVDVCACCAPHVANSGEVGLIKVLDFIKYKGGTRLFILSGTDAFKTFVNEHRMLNDAAVFLSKKRREVYEAVVKADKENRSLKKRLEAIQARSMAACLESIENTSGVLCFFFDGADNLAMRSFANEAVKKCTVAAVFSADTEGYKYIIASETVDLRAVSKQINERISGRGGGSSSMLQGSCIADRETVEKYFEEML